MRVLVVEDEVKLAQALKAGLEQESYAVDVEHDGENGYLAAIHDEYDVIILDVMLPSMDGFTVCKKIRAEQKTTPILLLTAKDQDPDIITGLDAGADDYLPKPFSFDVLLARVRALLRRPQDRLGEVLQAGSLLLDINAKTVARNNQIISLSGKEYALLEYLLRNKGRVMSKDKITSHVWNFDADILPNTIEVFMTYLRAKVDKPFDEPPLIHTVRGFGYTIKDVKNVI